jgi:RHS repeat-associated protein
MKRGIRYSLCVATSILVCARFGLAADLTNAMGVASGRTSQLRSPDSQLQDVRLDRKGPDTSHWEATIRSTDGTGKVRYITNHFEELSTGANYFDSGEWKSSQAEFVEDAEGFVAQKLQHKVRLQRDLNVGGAVHIRTPDGKELFSTPVALGIYDPITGQFAVIGEITNCTGVAVSSNTVVYQDPFVAPGGNRLCGALVYTVGQATFEQDYVWTSAFDVRNYGFTSNAWLQVISEIQSAPEPDIIERPVYVEANQSLRRRMKTPDRIDQVIGFGELVLGTGHAYTSPGIDRASGIKALVTKEVRRDGDRLLLIESVPFSDLEQGLLSLPDCSSREEQASRPKKTSYAAITSPKSAVKAATARNQNKRETATLRGKPEGVVIDYTANIGGTLTGTRTFASSTNYIITGAVFCNGTAIIEGGTVFKYRVNGSLTLNGALTLKTAMYRPAVFTAVDDNSVGDSLNGIDPTYTGTINSGGYANPALYLSTSTTLSNCRFCYAKVALENDNSIGLSFTVNHAQLISCIKGIQLTGSVGSGSGSGSGVNLTMNNVLLANVQYPLTLPSSATGNSCVLVNCTIDQAIQLITGNIDNCGTTSKNSIYANISTLGCTPSGDHNGFSSSPTFGTSQVPPGGAVFQTMGSGYHYLTTASGFRNAGTSSGVLPTLIADLGKRTTFPPTWLHQTSITTDQTLAQVQRDTDTLDLGYHYDPGDYLISEVTVDNATLSFGPGFAALTYGNSGIILANNARLASVGTPLARNHISRYNTVGEQPIILDSGSVTENSSVKTGNSGLVQPSAEFRFTDFDAVNAWGYHLKLDDPVALTGSLVLRDCQFLTGRNSFGGANNSTLQIVNNLFERSESRFLYSAQLDLYNNLFTGGAVYFERYASANPWTAKDNVFDNCRIEDWSASPLAHDYNAYVNTFARLTPNGANDKILSSFTYASGVLGAFYQSTSTLKNRGSRPADAAGLYYHTTTTDQAREGTSQVDIGYHYVSTNCGPADTVWVDDAVPTGAAQNADGGDSWNWVTANPTSFSALSASQSAAVSGFHRHYFSGATVTLPVAVGDTMVAYVYLDPAHLPSEVMIEWYDGSWEHRAYWGANSINLGVDGTASRRNKGALPGSGQWVRLEVLASLVGLEGSTVSGISLALFDGAATWDYLGKKGGNLCYDTDSDGTPDYKAQDPVITLTGGGLSYTEDATPIFPGSGATVTDRDTANMAGGSLAVQILAPAQTSDQIDIYNEGTGPTQISLSGSTVLYEGAAIGTFTGGASGSPLRVTFSAPPANVSVAAVQGLIRHLRYWNTSQNFSPTTPRPLRITLYDGHGGWANAFKSLTVIPVPDAPTLTSITVLSGAKKNTPFTITYETLAAAANEADVDSSVIQFRMEAVSSGTLTKGGAAIVPGVTLLGPGEAVVWTPATGVFGNSINAFTVKAYDGSLASATAVQVAVNVANVDSAPVITLPSANPTAIKGDQPVVIDSLATVTDSDASSLNNGVLTVAVSAFATADDRLAFNTDATIGISGHSVTYNGTAIGTFTYYGTAVDTALTNLLFRFNSSADWTKVQALVRHLTYQNVSLAATQGIRTVKLVITDGGGASSLPAFKNINVTCPNGVDVMLVIDRSGSMDDPVSNPGLVAATNAAKQFATYLDYSPSRDQCGLISFSASATTDQTLTTSEPSIEAKLANIKNLDRSSTRIDLGIVAAMNELNSARHHNGNVKLLILLTDGANNADPGQQAIIDAATDAKVNHSIHIITIGLGYEIEHTPGAKDTLIAAASSPADFKEAPTSSDLAAIYAQIGINLCRLTVTPPVVSAGPDRVVYLVSGAGSTTLNGSVTDDGNTGNGVFNLIWSQVSCPPFGIATFGNASAAVTTVNFNNAVGTYIFRLTGANLQYTASDDMIVTVYPEQTGDNQPPNVRAYDVGRLVVGGSATLRGTVQDDGLPVGSTLTKTWTQISGPSVPPTNPHDVVTGTGATEFQASVGPFTQPGRYSYQLTGSDGQLSASDTINVTVCNGTPGPVDVVLVMDDSGSMSSIDPEDPTSTPRFMRARAAARTFLDFINQGSDQVAVVGFSGNAYLASQLSMNPATAREALIRLPAPGSSTAMDAGLYGAMDELISPRHRPGSLPVVILLSDGYPDDARAARFAANQLKNGGVRIITIGLVPNDPLAADFLKSISSSTDDFYTGITGTELAHIYASIAESFCLGQNHRPVVAISGPPSMVINYGDPLTLYASATDDGPPAALTYQWTLVRAYDHCTDTDIAGAVNFSAPTGSPTDVTFPSGPGEYLLRFTASDGTSSSFDEVTVLVNDIPAITINGPWGPNLVPPGSTFNANHNFTLSGLTVGARYRITNAGTDIPSYVNGPQVINTGVGGTAEFTAANSTLVWFCPNVGDPVLSIVQAPGQTLRWTGTEIVQPLLGFATVNDTIGQGYWNGIINPSWVQCPPLDTLWSIISGPFNTVSLENEYSVDNAIVHFTGPGRYVLRLTADDRFIFSTSDVVFNVLPQNSVFAGVDKTANTGVAISLSDAATNPDATSLAWSKQAGPPSGTPNFSSTTILNPTVSFNVSGSYIIRLTGTFGALTVYDELTIWVGTAGVHAGNDIIIPVGGTASLNGTAVNTAGAALSATWSVILAPAGGQVTFADATSKATTATFSQPGTYQLRLTATDGSADDLMVYVNQAPVVDAGPDISVAMLDNVYSFLSEQDPPPTLNGSIISDDLLPPNGATTINWSKVSGPGIVTFENVHNLKTHVTFSAEGTYVLKLSVSDSHLTGEDTVNVKAYIRPLAHGDAFLLERGSEPFVLDVLRNDFDPGGGPLTINDIWPYANDIGTPTAGTVTTINNNSQLLFVPNPNARVTAFMYRTREEHGGLSDWVWVTLIIMPPPHSPVANRDVVYSSVTAVNDAIDVLSNDDDGGYGPLTIVSYTQPQYGTLSLVDEHMINNPRFSFIPQYLQYTGDSVHYGIFTFTYTVRNQRNALSTGSVILVVDPAGGADTPPIVDAGIDQTIYVNQTLNLSGVVDDDGFNWPTMSWSASPSSGVNFWDPSQPVTTVTFPSPADYTLTLTANDGVNAPVSDSLVVHVLPEARPPIAEMFNLVNDPRQLLPDPVVTDGLYSLHGRADDPNPNNVITYRLTLYKPATQAGYLDTFVAWVTPNPDATPITGREHGRTLTGSPPPHITGDPGNDDLGQIDFTQVPNGVYILKLEVWGGANTIPAVTATRFALNTGLHLGRLTFAEEDLKTTAGGMPVRVSRNYDSSLGVGADFGGGWCLALQDLQAEIDEVRDSQDYQDDEGEPLNLRTGGGYDVTLTLPSGRRVTFRFALRVGSSGYAYAEYTSPPGVKAKLEPQGDNRLVYILDALSGGQIGSYWQDGGQQTPLEMYDFPGFILTLEDKTKFYINRDSDFSRGTLLPDGTFVSPRHGPLYVARIERPNGEKTEFGLNLTGDNIIQTTDAAGKSHVALTFKRGTSAPSTGRIISIIDGLSTEAQPAVKYGYDGIGRLSTVSRLASRSPERYDVTTYHYSTDPNFLYYIISIQDPRQLNLLRTQTTYWPDGKIQSITAGNATTTFDYDLAAKTETITDALNFKTIHTFNEGGQIIKTEVQDANQNLLSRTIQTYDPTTLLVTSQATYWKNQAYATTTYEYDAQRNITNIIDPNLLSTVYSYNGLNQVVSITDPLTHTTVNTYDPDNGNLLSTVDPGGGTTLNTYENGRLKTSTSPSGAITTYDYYDGETGGNPGDLKMTTITEADGSTILSRVSYTYDANGNTLTERRERKTGADDWSPIQALITTYTYDPQNRVIQTDIQADPADPQVISTSWTTYNAAGKVATQTDRLGRITRFYYDARGNLVQTEYPGNAVYPIVNTTITRTVYDSLGRPSYVQDRHDKPASGTSSTAPGHHLIYDGVGRIVRDEQLAAITVDLTLTGSGEVYATSLPAQTFTIVSATRTHYDYLGHIDETAQRRLDPGGDPDLETDRTRTSYEYDAGGRRLKTYVMVDDDTGNFIDQRLIQDNTYDDAGNVLSATDAAGSVTEYEYDAMNRRTLVRYPLATGESIRATRITGYDGAGRRTNEVDELKRATQFAYDGLDRLTKVTDPDLRVTKYRYDWFGNQLDQTDALNRVTLYRYDALSRRIRRELPGLQFETMTYDAEGNPLTRTDFNGKLTSYTYDVLNRLRKVTPDVSFTGETPIQFDYFPNGKRKQMIDSTGETDWTYDAVGRLQFKTAPAGKLSYAYNDTSGRRSVTVTTANQDGSARTGLGASSVTYKWNSLNQVASVIANGATTQYGFDLVGNLQSVQYPLGAGLETHYTYDVRNRLRDMTVGSLAHYVYDVLADNKRSRATESGAAVNSTGNRVADYTYDNINRLTKETITGDEANKNGDFAYTYDDVGNRTFYKAVPFGNNGTSSTFDENDRLTPSSNFDRNGNTTISSGSTLQYDFLDRLKARTSGTSVQLAYDGDGNLVSRTIGGMTTWYLVEDQNPTGYPQVIEEIASDQHQTLKRFVWGLALISQLDATVGTSYSGLDGHGNVRFLLDGVGNDRGDHYTYDASGRLIRSAGTTANAYRYCGERYDTDLGFYYLRARYLNADNGRFLSMDSFEGQHEDPLSLHKYSYCGDNPSNGRDPSGHEEIIEALEWLSPGYPPGYHISPENIPAMIRYPASTFTLSPQGLQLIAGFESFSPTVYVDAAGYDTVGFGHRLLSGEQATYASGITRDQGVELLKSDSRVAQSAVRSAVTAPLNQFEYDALVSFTFNVGGGNLKTSTLLKLLNQSDYEGAANEFPKWTRAGNRVLRGLQERRRKERILFRGESWNFRSELGFDPY